MNLWYGVALGMDFAGQVPVGRASLSQARIGRYCRCRECLQQVQCIFEKAKTTTLLLSPTAVIPISWNWTAENAHV